MGQAAGFHLMILFCLQIVSELCDLETCFCWSLHILRAFFWEINLLAWDTHDIKVKIKVCVRNTVNRLNCFVPKNFTHQTEQQRTYVALYWSSSNGQQVTGVVAGPRLSSLGSLRSMTPLVGIKWKKQETKKYKKGEKTSLLSHTIINLTADKPTKLKNLVFNSLVVLSQSKEMILISRKHFKVKFHCRLPTTFWSVWVSKLFYFCCDSNLL